MEHPWTSWKEMGGNSRELKMGSLMRLSNRIVQATVQLGGFVTGNHSWYDRMKPADQRNYALTHYLVLGSLLFFLLGGLVVLVANFLPALRVHLVALFALALFGLAALSFALFLAVSIGGLFAMMARDRPRKMEKEQPAQDSSAGARRLRRAAAFTLAVDVLVLLPLVATRQLPPFFLILFLASGVLWSLSFLPSRTRALPK